VAGILSILNLELILWSSTALNIVVSLFNLILQNKLHFKDYSTMAYLLQIDASPMGDNSVSRKLAATFAETYVKIHPGVEVKHRDLSASPVSHLDAETLGAGYVPEDKRSASQQAKHQGRLDLIKEITGAQAIVISTPMWNWNVPSVLKAYIDQIILSGTLDSYGAKGLTGKQVTILVACGGGGYGGDKASSDFVSNYLKHSKFTSQSLS